jgi:hypothetical protein
VFMRVCELERDCVSLRESVCIKVYVEERVCDIGYVREYVCERVCV